MTMPSPAPSLSWQVTGSTETTRYGANNVPIRGRLTEFVTGQGGTGTVFIPDTVTTPEAMRAVIQAAAERVDTVNSLTSGS